MKIAERIVMVVLLFVLLGFGVWIYFAVQFNHQEVLDGVARGDYEIPVKEPEPVTDVEEWRAVYPNTVLVMIGSSSVQASVADTLSKRIKGLSNTPFLPEKVVKLFVFGVEGTHSIWMKDMNYALDIIWVAKSGEIVHIEENVSPDSYPESFASPLPAWYVIEAKSGFVSADSIELGDKVVVPVQ